MLWGRVSQNAGLTAAELLRQSSRAYPTVAAQHHTRRGEEGGGQKEEPLGKQGTGQKPSRRD
jgi:hypothetical protein